MIQRVKIVIQGAVQGVGFRPFVFRLATDLKLNGWIINSSQGVFIEAEGEPGILKEFLARLKTDKPKNSFIQSFEHSYLDPAGFEKFEIRESNEKGAKTALVLPDIATCPDCLEEIFNPNDRRYLYPFTNCTNCGPRFSIITSLPYDRANTSMGEFEMCEKCRKEYEDPLNRRFHAEPTACPVCGPKVYLTDTKGNILYREHEAILNAVSALKEGKIVALKGIGGYQLICDASNDLAVKTLRSRKRRSEKPFALMFPNLNSVIDVCEVSKEEESLLLSNEAPIVLLKKKNNEAGVVSKETVINNPFLGVMLPYSPLHHILMRELGTPVIATSGNISEEPICIDEVTAYEKLGDIADFFLSHNRKIIRHVDDSIARIILGREMLMRRARGYAPLPVKIKGLDKAVLAVGGHLKNTIAVNKDENVFISQHIGDLENIESITAFKNVINDLESFYEITPLLVVCDLHPEYISTKFAGEQSENVVSVQHHFAHVLSCIAENEIEGKVLGFSWDGTGYGTDGVIWGSECMIVENNSFKRFAHLKPFKLPGGEAAIHEVWRIGVSLLNELNKTNKYGNFKDLLVVIQMMEKGINSPLTNSMGRFFDGVSSLIGIRDNASFEAQAAMELEFAAIKAAENVTDDLANNDYFEFRLEKNSTGEYIIGWEKIIKGILNESAGNKSKEQIALKFHNTLVEIISEVSRLSGCKKIVLTGGCFQNKLLLEKAIERLAKENYKVYWHQRVPPNDGGISLGQVKFASYK